MEVRREVRMRFGGREGVCDGVREEGVWDGGPEARRLLQGPIKAGELLSGTVLCGGCQEPLTVRLFARPHLRIAASSSQNLHGNQTAEVIT